MEKKFNLELTENEAAVLLNLLDGAVRHFGRPAAQSVAVFEQKIAAAKEASGHPFRREIADLPKQN